MEIYKDVVGYNGKYEVSNMGNVRSLTRIALCKSGRLKTSVGRVLNKERNRNGYLRVSLSDNCKVTHKYIHRLVAESFLENVYKLATVNHINGNKLDNRVKNLEWSSYLDNCHHAENTGLAVHYKGKNHYNSRKTHCIHGHLFDEKNTSFCKCNPVYRVCKECNRLRAIRYRKSSKDLKEFTI